MLAEVARHQARLSIVTAARAGADDERDLPAGVEFGNRLRRRSSCGEEHGSREQKRDTVHRRSNLSMLALSRDVGVRRGW
jgi:hypothetical protein